MFAKPYGNAKNTKKCVVCVSAYEIKQQDKKRLVISASISFAVILIQSVGGYYSNSLAIATDAVHSLSDFASFLASLFAIWLSERDRTHRMTFGFHRAEVIGALFSVLLIWLATGVLAFEAIQRVKHQEFEVHGLLMVGISVFTIFVNIVLVFVLVHYKAPKKQKGNSNAPKSGINIRSAYIHVIGDILQSVGVLIASLIVYFLPSWKLADPICTFIFSILVLITTIHILRDVFRVLMEGTPQGIAPEEVADLLLSISSVSKIHSLRLWSLTTERTAFSAHLIVDPESDHNSVLEEAVENLVGQFPMMEVTLQLEEGEPLECCKLCA